MKKVVLLLLSGAFALSPVPVAQSAPSGWSAPELIPAPDIGVLTPPPVFDARGDAFLAWTERKLTVKESITLEYPVRTSMRPVDGSWQAPETLSHLGAYPGVAVDAGGDEIAVWQGFSGIQATTRAAGGGWLAPQMVARSSADPKVASDASGDAIIVAQRIRSMRSTGIRAVLRLSGEDTFSPAQAVSAPGNDFEQRIAINARGDAVVAWEREPAHGCIVEAAFRPANGSWSRPRALADAHAGCQLWEYQEVAIDDHGDSVVTWLTSRGRTGFIESASRGANGRWTARRILAKGRMAGTVDLGMDARGDAIVVWDEWALNSHEGSAMWMRIRPAGHAWGPAQQIPGAKNGTPSLAIDPRGDALIAWWSKRGIEAAARPAGGRWQKPYTLSEHERIHDGRVLAALDARGDAIVTWQNHDGIVTAWNSALFP